MKQICYQAIIATAEEISPLRDTNHFNAFIPSSTNMSGRNDDFGVIAFLN